MAEPAEVDGVLQVTGLTQVTPADSEPAPSAAPSEETYEAQPAEEPAAASEDDSTTQTSDAPEGEVSRGTDGELQAAPAKKPSRGVQKALDRLTERAVKAETHANEVSGALAAVLQQLNNQRQAPAPQQRAQPVQVEAAPDRKDYPDWEQFNRATAQWEARQASQQVVRQELGNFVKALVGQQQHNAAMSESQQLMNKLEQARAKAPERFPDWDEVKASDASISPSLFHAITISDDPALVMHHLGIHPDEHAKLLQMSPAQQLYQVGRIVASGQSTQSVVSRAPAPARPVAAVRGGVGSSQYGENMTPEQHKAWIKKQGVDRGIR